MLSSQTTGIRSCDAYFFFNESGIMLLLQSEKQVKNESVFHLVFK